MKSCDLSLVTKLIPSITYHKAVIYAGIENALNHMPFADREVYMLEGRGIVLVDDLFDRLNITYHRLALSDIGEVDLNRLVIIMPKVEPDKLLALSANKMQLFFTYTTYLVESISADTLSLISEDQDGQIEEDYPLVALEHLLKLQAKPLGRTLQILYVPRQQFDLPELQHVINQNMRQLLEARVYHDQYGGWVKGPQMYQKVADVLSNQWHSLHRVAKYILFQSMLNGSSYFYRREYSRALLNLGLIKEEQATQLYDAANAWRALARYIRKHANDTEVLDDKEITRLVEKIESNECRCFETLMRG